MRSHLIAVGSVVLLVAACAPGSVTSPDQIPAASPVATRSATPRPATPTRSPSPRVTSSPGTSAAFDPTGLTLRADVAVDGLVKPLDVTHAGDGSGRVFVVEQGGRIRVVRDGKLVARPFLDIADRIDSGGERGLLGLAFHPDYPDDPRFFVDYTDRDGDTVIAAFTVSGSDADVADPASEAVILRIDQPFPNHNGGAVEFGPDGMLYVGMGDGGSAGDPKGNGRSLGTLLAKILRVDIDGGGSAPYAIPADNPFVDVVGARPEIWATGMRNPWRMNFDRGTGDLWIGDVGQDRWEEIDVIRAGVGGLDFGWSTMEGFQCFRPAEGCDQTGLTLPITYYGHEFGRAVIGGVVVRDPGAGRLDGGYLYGDGYSDNLWALDPVGDERRDGVIVAKIGRTLSSIGEAEDGTVYATSLGGSLLRISAAN